MASTLVTVLALSFVGEQLSESGEEIEEIIGDVYDPARELG